MNTTTRQYPTINSKPSNLSNNLLIYLIALTATFAVIFPNYPIAGTSPAIFLLVVLFLFNIFLFQKTQKIIFPKSILNLTLLYILFCIAMTFSFFLNGATSASDFRYLASLYGNSAWILLITYSVIRSQHFLREFLRLFIPSVFCLIILGYLYFLLLYGDPLFLRHEVSDSFIREISIFNNANYFARFSLSILVIITLNYFYLRNKKANSKLTFYLMSVAISILILFSQSRTNLLALIIFWIGLTSIIKRKSGFSFSKSLKKLLFATFLIFIILSIPEINDRIFKGLGKMLDAISSNASGVDLPIRLRTWFASIEIFRNFPIFGIGFSKMEEVMIFFDSVKYIGKDEVSAVQIHGGFLKILNFGGLVAFLPFLYFIYYNFKLSKVGIKKSKTQQEVDLFRLLRLLLTLLIISNISADSFGVPHTWFTLAFVISASITYQKRNTL